MDIANLTEENLKKLIEVSNNQNSFRPDYLTWDTVVRDSSLDTFLVILYLSNFELFEIAEFKEPALEFIFKKELSEMPLYINDNTDYGRILNTSGTVAYYNWITIVALWRLSINC